MPQSKETSNLGDVDRRSGSGSTDGGNGKPRLKGAGYVLPPSLSSFRNLGLRERAGAFRVMFDQGRYHVLQRADEAFRARPKEGGQTLSLIPSVESTSSEESWSDDHKD